MGVVDSTPVNGRCTTAKARHSGRGTRARRASVGGLHPQTDHANTTQSTHSAAYVVVYRAVHGWNLLDVTRQLLGSLGQLGVCGGKAKETVTTTAGGCWSYCWWCCSGSNCEGWHATSSDRGTLVLSPCKQLSCYTCDSVVCDSHDNNNNNNNVTCSYLLCAPRAASPPPLCLHPERVCLPPA